MKLFNLDSPLMNILGKMADLMWLNILTMICCIPIITVGPAMTALHYMALKIVRNEECYITRGYFKSFKENFKQGILIWLIVLAVIAIMAGDIYIILNADIEFHVILKGVILVAGVMAIMTATFVFPVLSKFENNIKNTLKNAFFMSIWQFPKTILMIIFSIVPFVLMIFFYQMFPIVFLFGLSLPALGGAFLYNKTFQKLEDKMLEGQEPEEGNPEGENPEEDERIFKDELDESLEVK